MDPPDGPHGLKLGSIGPPRLVPTLWGGLPTNRRMPLENKHLKMGLKHVNDYDCPPNCQRMQGSRLQEFESNYLLCYPVRPNRCSLRRNKEIKCRKIRIRNLTKKCETEICESFGARPFALEFHGASGPYRGSYDAPFGPRLVPEWRPIWAPTGPCWRIAA